MDVVFKLPPEIFGGHILRFLTGAEIARMDSSVRQTSEWQNALAYLDHAVLLEPHVSSMLVWKWFWDRGIALKEIVFTILAADEMIGTSGTCDNWITHSIEIKYFSNHHFSAMVGVLKERNMLHKVHTLSGQMILYNFATFPNLRRWNVTSESLDELEHAQIAKFLSTCTVEQLSISYSDANRRRISLDETVLEAFQHSTFGGRFVQSLCLRGLHANDALLSTLSLHCPQLRILAHSGSTRAVSELGLCDLLGGCRQLAELTLEGLRGSDAVFLLCTQQFPNMRVLNVSLCMLTNAALRDLTRGCKGLRELSCKWAVDKLAVAAAARPWLGRLTALSVDCSSLRCKEMLKAAIRDAAHLQRLCLRSITEQHADLLRQLAVTCPRLNTFVLRGENFPQLDAIIAHICTMHTELRDLSVPVSQEWGRTQHTQNIAAACPYLTRLELRGCNGLYPRVLPLLAERCPRLEVLHGAIGSDATDDALLALLDGCPRLRDLDLQKCLRESWNASDNVLHKVERTLRERAQPGLYSRTGLPPDPILFFVLAWAW